MPASGRPACARPAPMCQPSFPTVYPEKGFHPIDPASPPRELRAESRQPGSSIATGPVRRVQLTAGHRENNGSWCRRRRWCRPKKGYLLFKAGQGEQGKTDSVQTGRAGSDWIITGGLKPGGIEPSSTTCSEYAPAHRNRGRIRTLALPTGPRLATPKPQLPKAVRPAAPKALAAPLAALPGCRVLHTPADFFGHRDYHHACRISSPSADTADRAVSGDRAAHRDDHRPIRAQAPRPSPKPSPRQSKNSCPASRK